MDGESIMSSNDQHNLKHRWKMKFRPIDYMVYNFQLYCFAARVSFVVTTRDVESELKKKYDRLKNKNKIEHDFSSSYGLAMNVSFQVLILMLRRCSLFLNN